MGLEVSFAYEVDHAVFRQQTSNNYLSTVSSRQYPGRPKPPKDNSRRLPARADTARQSRSQQCHKLKTKDDEEKITKETVIHSLVYI